MIEGTLSTLEVGVAVKNQNLKQIQKIIEEDLKKYFKEDDIFIEVKTGERIIIGDSDYSTDGRDVYFKATAIGLTQSEYNFIEPLIKNPGQFISFEKIINNGKFESSGYYHADEQTLYRIRKKFEAVVKKEGKKIISRSKGKLIFNTSV